MINFKFKGIIETIFNNLLKGDLSMKQIYKKLIVLSMVISMLLSTSAFASEVNDEDINAQAYTIYDENGDFVEEGNLNARSAIYLQPGNRVALAGQNFTKGSIFRVHVKKDEARASITLIKVPYLPLGSNDAYQSSFYVQYVAQQTGVYSAEIKNTGTQPFVITEFRMQRIYNAPNT